MTTPCGVLFFILSSQADNFAFDICLAFRFFLQKSGGCPHIYIWRVLLIKPKSTVFCFAFLAARQAKQSAVKEWRVTPQLLSINTELPGEAYRFVIFA